MDHLSDNLSSIWQSIVNQKEVATAEQIEKSEKHRDNAEPELTEMTLPDAYERHLHQFMQSEKRDFQSDGGDCEPLCDCSDPYCPLKEARLPGRVKLADTLEDGIRDYRRQHDGNARVLADAREAWVEKYSEVKRHLERALTTLRGAPEPEPGADDSDVEAEAAADEAQASD